MAKAGFEQLAAMEQEIQEVKDKKREIGELIRRQDLSQVDLDTYREVYGGLRSGLARKERELRELRARLRREGQPLADPVEAVKAKYRNYEKWNTARERLGIVLGEIDTLIAALNDYHAVIVKTPYGAYHTLVGHAQSIHGMRRMVLRELGRMRPRAKADMNRELEAAQDVVKELRQKEARREAVRERFGHLLADKEAGAAG